MVGRESPAACHRPGVTLVELLMALAIMVVIAATVFPMFAVMRNHWGRILDQSETTQNARVLFDHLHRELTQAQRIVALSAPEDPHGTLVFQRPSGQTFRYEQMPDGTLHFGDAAATAGLVSRIASFQVLGYDLTDSHHAIHDPNRVRYVEVCVRFSRDGNPGARRDWRGGFYLRASQTEAAGTSAVIGRNGVRPAGRSGAG